MASHFKEAYHCLTRKLIDYIERACTIGRSGIVSQIEVIVLGQQLTDSMKDGQSAISAVKDANRPWVTTHYSFFVSSFRSCFTASVMSSPKAGLMNVTASLSVFRTKA